MHQLYLLFDDLLTVLGMLHRFTIQVHVLGIDGLLIQHLVEFGTQVFHPVVPLGTSAVIAQRLNVNHSTNIG